MQENSERWDVGENETLLLLPNGRHGSYKPCDQTTHFYWLHMQTSGQWFPQSHPSATVHSAATTLFDSTAFDLALPKSEELNSPQAEPIFRQLIDLTQSVEVNERFKEQILFYQLVQLLMAVGTTQPRNHSETVAQEALAYLNTHYREPINDESLSRALSYHPGYITRCFKKSQHTTPTAYLMQVRLSQAQRLLTSSELSIEHIAAAVGYPNVSYFSRLFKQRIGTSPSTYRNSLQNKGKQR